MKSFIC